MNRLMASILLDYLMDMPDEEYEAYGDHLDIFLKCIKKLDGSYRSKSVNIAFSIDTIGDMVCILVNQQAVEMLSFALKSGQAREITALRKAIADPMTCMSLRIKKYGQHLNGKSRSR